MERDLNRWRAELAALHAAGRLSDEEYAAARTQLVRPDDPAASFVDPAVPRGRAAATSVVAMPLRPPPSARWRDPWVAAGLVVLFVAAMVVVMVLDRREAPPPPASTASTASTSAPQAPPTAAPAPGARGRLDQQVRTDAAAVEPLVDRWVPQLYAGRIGAVRGAANETADSVLRDYDAVRQQYPSALLLVSGTFTSFELPDYYVVVLPTPFATPAEVLAWCTQQRRADEYCFAKRLSHTAGPAGSTVYRN